MRFRFQSLTTAFKVVGIIANISVWFLALYLLAERWVQPAPSGWSPLAALFVGPAPPPTVDYKDFVSILLTALGVMIAVGSVGLALMALFGWAEGRKMVEKAINDAIVNNLTPKTARAALEAGSSDTTAEEASDIVQTLNDGNG